MTRDPFDMPDEPQENNFRRLYELLSAQPERFPTAAEHHRGTLLEALRLAAEQFEAQKEYERTNAHYEKDIRF